MSVWTSAVIRHPWNDYSEEAIKRISLAATGSNESTKWFGGDGAKTVSEDFKAHGYTSFFLPSDFCLHFYSNILELGLAIRWSSFLTNPKKHQDFLKSCKAVAKLTSATELILLPEGVADLFISDGITFQEFKSAAVEKLGPPNLDVRKLYTEQEVGELPQSRVHYCHAMVADI